MPAVAPAEVLRRVAARFDMAELWHLLDGFDAQRDTEAENLLT